MSSSSEEWIGVEQVAAEMAYTPRQAWEFIRSIGLSSVNAKRMDLIRFTRAEFAEARERAKAPIPARSKSSNRDQTKAPPGAKKNKASVEEALARIRRA